MARRDLTAHDLALWEHENSPGLVSPVTLLLDRELDRNLLVDVALAWQKARLRLLRR